VPVRRFVEKPNLAKAKQYLKGGKHLWNAGIFIFSAEQILSEMEQYMPALDKVLCKLEPVVGKKSFAAALERSFRNLEPESIDYGIMEKADQIFTVPATFSWSDVGSFAALPEVCRLDKAGNVADGDTLLLDSEGCVVLSRGERLVAAVGVKDLVVVDAGDAVLVCPKAEAQKVKLAVNALKKAKRNKLL
jgi:mannose-1-phosphate guanylyltransferase